MYIYIYIYYSIPVYLYSIVTIRLLTYALDSHFEVTNGRVATVHALGGGNSFTRDRIEGGVTLARQSSDASLTDGQDGLLGGTVRVSSHAYLWRSRVGVLEVNSGHR